MNMPRNPKIKVLLQRSKVLGLEENGTERPRLLYKKKQVNLESHVRGILMKLEELNYVLPLTGSAQPDVMH